MLTWVSSRREGIPRRSARTIVPIASTAPNPGLFFVADFIASFSEFVDLADPVGFEDVREKVREASVNHIGDKRGHLA